jgi:hypothetical protein
MTMRKRRSSLLANLKRELHQRAIKEKDEKRRKDYWRMYFQAKNAEGEIREMVLEVEVSRLKEFLRADGYDDELLDEPDAPQPPDHSIDEDAIPPRQKGLWEDE